jgi:hypothetical protein
VKRYARTVIVGSGSSGAEQRGTRLLIRRVDLRSNGPDLLHARERWRSPAGDQSHGGTARDSPEFAKIGAPGGSGCRDYAGERGWTTANPSGQPVRRIGVGLCLATASGGDGMPGWCSGHQRVLHGTTSRTKGRGASGIAHRGPETSGDTAQRRLRRGLAVR